jgi:hypothetical protein
MAEGEIHFPDQRRVDHRLWTTLRYALSSSDFVLRLSLPIPLGTLAHAGPPQLVSRQFGSFAGSEEPPGTPASSVPPRSRVGPSRQAVTRNRNCEPSVSLQHDASLPGQSRSGRLSVTRLGASGISPSLHDFEGLMGKLVKENAFALLRYERGSHASLSSREILESGRYLERGAPRGRGPSRRQDPRSGRRHPRRPGTRVRSRDKQRPDIEP